MAPANAEQVRKALLKERADLPVFKVKDRILKAVASKQVTLLVGETGSGKTTQVPQFLREAGYCDGGLMVGITQPRRVAATSVAERVAQESGVSLGSEVGYTIRFQDKTSKSTEIKFMTDGMLVREAVGSLNFESYSVIILDEVHERSLHTDLLLGLVKQAMVVRPDLKVVLMSATIKTERYMEFFGGEDACCILDVPGRQHPVEIMYTPAAESDYLEAAMITVLQLHTEKPLPGDILVFLSGQDEIEGLQQLLLEKRQCLGKEHHDLLVCPMFAALPFDEQMSVFNAPPAGTRKVVLATNIAETSITISGIKYVVDTGFVKLKVCHPTTGVEILRLSPTSQAAANQRKGRAGREGPGEAYRLYIEDEFDKMIPQTPPEILRIEVATAYLQLRALGIDVQTFPFLDRPSDKSLTKAAQLLRRINALDNRGGLTQHGQRLATLPLHPLFANALLHSEEFECVAEMLSLVSMLSTDSLFYFSKTLPGAKAAEARRQLLTHPDGDHLSLLRTYKQWSKARDSRAFAVEHGLNQHSMLRAKAIREQLKELLPRVGIKHVTSVGGPENWDKVRMCLLKATFVNAATLVDSSTYATLIGRLEAKIHPHSSMFKRHPLPKNIVFTEFVTTSKNYLRTVSEVDPAWLMQLCPQYFVSAKEASAA